MEPDSTKTPEPEKASSTPPPPSTPPADNANATGPDDADDANSLEAPEGGTDQTVVEGQNSPPGSIPGAESPEASPLKPPSGFKGFLIKFNIYLLLFVLILLLAFGVIIVSYFQSQKAAPTIKAQNLTQSDLSQIANSDSTVGNVNQVLNVQSNAVFAGQVLVKGALQVAAGLQIGGAVTLQSLTVNGQSTLSDLQVTKNINVAGNIGVSGEESVSQGLQVDGSGTFNGSLTAPQITTSSLQLNGDLTLIHHIIAGGSLPTRQNGPALGGGGTASVSGSDTSGSVSINTGDDPTAGCFVTVVFATPFPAVPHVLITPIGSAAGGMAYYVNRLSTSFSICDDTQPPAGSSFGFDYFVVD